MVSLISLADQNMAPEYQTHQVYIIIIKNYIYDELILVLQFNVCFFFISFLSFRICWIIFDL